MRRIVINMQNALFGNAIAETLAMDVTGFELFLALAMANFALELIMNILLSPIVVRLLDIWGKNRQRKKV